MVTLPPGSPLKTNRACFWASQVTDSKRSDVGAPAQATVTESKHSALFCPVPVVCPSSQIVIVVRVATTVPLKVTQFVPVKVCGGFKSMAVAQQVEAVGLTLTVQVEFKYEFPRIQPENW